MNSKVKSRLKRIVLKVVSETKKNGVNNKMKKKCLLKNSYSHHVPFCILLTLHDLAYLTQPESRRNLWLVMRIRTTNKGSGSCQLLIFRNISEFLWNILQLEGEISCIWSTFPEVKVANTSFHSCRSYLIKKSNSEIFLHENNQTSHLNAALLRMHKSLLPGFFSWTLIAFSTRM